MSEKKIDPKNPNTAPKLEAEDGPTEESRTSQRVASRTASRTVNRTANRTVNKRII
jgi:hypothetical protein